MEVDPWQRISLDAILSVDKFGKWAASEFGELVARQNGKGNILLPYSLGHALLWPRPDGQPKLIVHTAHEVKTSAEAFRRLERAIRSSPLLFNQLKGGERGIKRQNGEEGFEFSDGSRIRYISRSKNSGVGFTCDVLIIDEAQEMSEEALNALLPTMSNVPNPQILYTGTVPAESNDYAVWESVRDRGRSSADRTGWIEYSPPGAENPDEAALIDRTDPEVWEWSNPGLGLRFLTGQGIEDELGRLKPDSFDALRLSIWPNRREDEAPVVNSLDFDAWEATTDDARLRHQHGELITLSPAVSDDVGYASIVAGSLLPDGRVLVEHLETRGGTLWVAERLGEWRKQLGAVSIVLDERKCAAILSDLKRHKLKWLPMRPGEVAAAHAMLTERWNAGMICHRRQDELTTSFQHAAERNVGQLGKTWTQADDAEPVTLAQAATQAHWGVKNYEASPPKKGKVRGIA